MYTVTPAGGTFNDVLPGDPWQPEPAARYNAVNELLRQESFTTPDAPPWSRGELTCVNVLNTSDRTLLFNRAVQLDSEFARSQDKIDYSNLYACGRPVENEEGFWGVALENIEPGHSGMVQVNGIICLRHVWGEYSVPDPVNPSKTFCRNNFIAAGVDGVYHLVNRGQARVIWYCVEQESAIVMLNCHGYFYDGMFTVLDNGNGTLTVKGGMTDLPTASYSSDVCILEDTIIPVYAIVRTTYVCLTAVRKSNGGWNLSVAQTGRPNGSDLYSPGERIVWPLASYIDISGVGHVRGLVQLHQGGAVNFRDRYYGE